MDTPLSALEPSPRPGPDAPAAVPAAAAPVIDTDTGDTGRTDGRAASSKPRRLKVRTLLAWVAGGLVLLVVGALIGFLIARSQADDNAAELVEVRQQLGVVQKALSQAEERNWNYYRVNEALRAEIENAGSEGSTSTTVPQPSTSRQTYGDGVYLVGEDIAVGTYDGVVTGEVGYWARLKATDGLVSSIVANALPRGPFVLTIIVSDKAAELRGVEITTR